MKIAKIIKKETHPIFSLPRTFGQKASDKITKWVGSWIFLILLSFLLFLWILLNTSWLFFGKYWDPQPFILLNLILSFLTALQAPIILMSQNRANERDRIRTEYDYAVNRKAEKEIQELKKQLDRIEKKFAEKRK